MPEKKLLRRSELPAYLLEKHGIVVAYQTFNKYGCIGGGPDFLKFGNQALYEPERVDRWVAERLGKAA